MKLQPVFSTMFKGLLQLLLKVFLLLIWGVIKFIQFLLTRLQTGIEGYLQKAKQP